VVHTSGAAHHISATMTKSSKMVVVMVVASSAEAKNDAWPAVICVTAMAATVAVTTVAVAVASIVHLLGELLRHADIVRWRYGRCHGSVAEQAGREGKSERDDSVFQRH
jgi:hypothetical protein